VVGQDSTTLQAIPGPISAAEGDAAGATVSTFDPLAGGDSPKFRSELDAMASQMTGGVEVHAVTAAMATGMAVSVGYAVWLVRASHLIATAPATAPAWRALDPLAVLEARGDGSRRRDDDPESVGAILQRRRRAPGAAAKSPRGVR
jgi:hypothetical protein